ncbi:hypothetical protein [Cytobacillus sp. FSL H8-0458]|uniref:hypothetical protein n=1 Tax=Cytobacillus sp. FSL H8-0458 TaxID=2975346 RepID=UPI0030F8244B
MLANFLTILSQKLQPVYFPAKGMHVAGQWAGFQRSATAVERIADVLEEPDDSEEVPSYSVSKPLMSFIRFQDINFSMMKGLAVFYIFTNP